MKLQSIQKLGLAVLISGIGLATVPGTNTAAGADQVVQNDKDQRIEIRIKGILDRDTRVDLTDVDVSNRDGTVFLEGSVLTEFERLHAGRLAGGVPKVGKVINKITVVEPLNTDFKLAKKIRSEILQNPALHVSKLKVEVRGGKVTLQGLVRSEDEKAMVGEFIQGFRDVGEFTNGLVVVEDAGLDPMG